MSDYRPPVDDMVFTLSRVIGLTEVGPDDLRLILDSAASLAAEVLAPLNAPGDKQGSRWDNGAVTTPKGFKEAYARYRDGGWNGVPFDPDFGGQGLPWSVAFAVQEMWQSANMSFGLCPLLNQAAVEAVAHHGSAEQKKIYLEKLVTGEWTGTMNLTEPQAGSDLAAIRAKAEKQTDGSYKISGQKIFITYGEHDLAGNIIHMVLARVPGAPEGVKGISLFIVPKFIPNADGKPGKRNDVKCVSVEHKLGIHASPTCTMQYGDEGGATGWLVGSENEGLKYMFTMMNNARLCVGLQGVAIAERAVQHALVYAQGRVQGTRMGDKSGERVAIIEHADVKRMLLTMQAQVMAGRLLVYEAGHMLDRARGGDKAAQAHVDLLTPVVKSWCTDMALAVTSAGVQIHGGMGFIEETGAAQFYRDARILPIYEGTNGIQALDLVFRKTLMDKGAAMMAWLTGADDVAAGNANLSESLAALRRAAGTLATLPPDAAAAVAVPYLNAFGVIAGGVMMARAASVDSAYEGLAHIYMTHILPAWRGHVETVMTGSAAVTSSTSAGRG